MELRWDRWTPLSLKHTGPTVSHMKYLGRLRRVREHIFGAFGVFSCVGSFWTVWTASAPIQYAKSENVGCWPLDALTGCVLAVWPFWLAVCWRISAVCRRGGILCVPLNSMMRALFFMHSVPSFLVFNATFLPNGSDERQQSGWIKAVGCWFESGRCVSRESTSQRNYHGQDTPSPWCKKNK